MTSSVRVIIKGRVQGVGYRAWTVSHASRNTLQGWVRNRADGSVEAVFHGESEAVTLMIEACKKGPMLARVDSIESYAWNDGVEGNTFIAKPTI